MIKFLLILLIPFTLFGSKILSYNIYDRTDRVDVMITFDTPYEGVIKQSVGKSKIIIKLEDSKIESSKLKQLSSKFLRSLNITPMQGYTQIVAHVPPSVILKASKTSDAYGLRLRFTSKTTNNTKITSNTSTNSISTLPTKQDTNISQSYYIVIIVLIIGIAILFYLRQKVVPKQNSNKVNAWSFKDTNQASTTTKKIENQDVSIRFQKSIDHDNSVVMLDFGEQSFLVLMGRSNILLDKYTDNKPSSQEDFESILQSRHEELDQFLRVENPTKEPLQAYKERAASIKYEG